MQVFWDIGRFANLLGSAGFVAVDGHLGKGLLEQITLTSFLRYQVSGTLEENGLLLSKIN